MCAVIYLYWFLAKYIHAGLHAGLQVQFFKKMHFGNLQ